MFGPFLLSASPLGLTTLSPWSPPGERLLHPSGGVQSGQGRLADSAQLPHVQDVLLSIWRNAGEERNFFYVMVKIPEISVALHILDTSVHLELRGHVHGEGFILWSVLVHFHRYK